MINMCWEKYNPVAPIAKKKKTPRVCLGLFDVRLVIFHFNCCTFQFHQICQMYYFPLFIRKKERKDPSPEQAKKGNTKYAQNRNGWPFKQSDLASLEGRYKGFVPIYLSVDTYRTFVHFKHLFSGFVRGNTRLEVNINLWNGNKRFGYEWMNMNELVL